MLTQLTLAHSNLISPMPRNAVDRTLEPWSDPVWGPGSLPHNASCPHPINFTSPTQPAHRCWGCTCVNGTEPCMVAQTCVWFSNGCSIGCAACDSGADSNPNKRDRCKSGMRATNNDPFYRTYNRNVTAFSAADWTRWNPWRAPGAAPVHDPCGMAGGSPHWQATGLSFIDTKHAKQGALGSVVLPKAPTGVEWKAGSKVEAKWNVRANHGGGYSYRLCSAKEKLTEVCFQRTPMRFANNTQLEWSNGTRRAIEGRFLTSAGNSPPNSQWAMNPLPYSDDHMAPTFPNPCGDEPVDRMKNDTGRCSGRFPWDVSIVDELVVPSGLPAGEYVLGFRYDCEATAQVWSSCADIEIS